MSKAEVILHPTRLRLIQAFGAGRRLTAQQLAALVPDIPHASLYRHLHLLTHAGILAVVAERPQPMCAWMASRIINCPSI